MLCHKPKKYKAVWPLYAQSCWAVSRTRDRHLETIGNDADQLALRPALLSVTAQAIPEISLELSRSGLEGSLTAPG